MTRNRAQRRYLANRIAKRRFRHHNWVKDIGRLRKNNFSCSCILCTWDKYFNIEKSKNMEKKEDNELIKETKFR